MNSKFRSGRWNNLEKEAFLQAFAVRGPVWNDLSVMIGSRTPAQCRSHYQKLMIKERVSFKTRFEENVVLNDVKCQESVEKVKMEKDEKVFDEKSTSDSEIFRDSSTEDRIQDYVKNSCGESIGVKKEEDEGIYEFDLKQFDENIEFEYFCF
jgi:hypothetical protein